jgi:cell division protein FtsL
MTMTPSLAGLALALLAACGLYLLTDQVRRQEHELDLVQNAIAAERGTLSRLRVEWALLNQPSRIARLARAHLGLQPAAPSQIMTIDTIPLQADLELGQLRLTAVLPSGGEVPLRLKPSALMSLPALAGGRSRPEQWATR